MLDWKVAVQSSSRLVCSEGAGWLSEAAAYVRSSGAVGSWQAATDTAAMHTHNITAIVQVFPVTANTLEHLLLRICVDYYRFPLPSLRRAKGKGT